MRKACKTCKLIVEKGNVCPACHGTDLTSNFQGMIIIFDVESEIAKKLGIAVPGKYALKI